MTNCHSLIHVHENYSPVLFSKDKVYLCAHIYSSLLALAGRCNNVQAADIVFLVDGSSSIGRANFLQVKGFMAGIVKPFASAVSQTGIRFGAIQYSDTSRWLTGL